MHVSRTHFADGADLNGDMANQRRDQIGDAASNRSNEQIDSHTPKAPPFNVKAFRITGS